jgi:NADH-quinone oxidoreductase subunit N
MTMITADTINLLIPEIILVAAATGLYMTGAFARLRNGATWIAVAAVVVAGIAMFAQDDRLGLFSASPASSTLNGPLVVDLFGHTVRWAILGIGVLLLMLTANSSRADQRSEENASLLMMLAGLMLAATANDLVLLFVGLELVSIPTYIVLYIGQHDSRGQEAASKYFFLSILASAVMLYGFSFLYGVAGSTRLDQIAAALSAGEHTSEVAHLGTTLAPLAMLLVFAGLAFRLTAVPFHFYAPDVYQGTSNLNAGVLSTIPKIAGLAVLSRILLAAMPGWELFGWKVVLVVSLLTMTLGNVLALWQNNIRRLLAYSSIAHAGYILIGLAVALAGHTTDTGTAQSGSPAVLNGLNGLGASWFYLAVYMLATLGTFAALVYLGREDAQVNTLGDMLGLGRRHPVVAIFIALFMFSLAGIPPLAGFFGKFSLLYGALTIDEYSSQNAVWLRPWFLALAVVAVLNAAIAAAYYLRVIGAMYFNAPKTAAAAPPANSSANVGPAFAMTVCAALVVAIGLMPKGVLNVLLRAGQSLREPGGDAAAGNSVPPADRQIAADR